MFGFLKKKLAEAVESVSSKLKKKEEEEQKSPELLQPQPEEVKTLEPDVLVEPSEETKVDITTPIPVEEVAQEKGVVEPAPTVETKPEVKTEESTQDFLERKLEELEKNVESLTKEVEKSEETQVIEETKLEVEERMREPALVSEVPKEPEAKIEEQKIPEIEEKKSFFKKITEKVIKKVTEKRLAAEEIDPILSNLETSLIESDVAVDVAEKIKIDLRAALVDREIKRGREKDVIVESFRNSLTEILNVPNLNLDSIARQKKPVLIVFWGFNGAGKTTSLAKTASWLKSKGYTCVLAAADTFRAGAEEQLDIHAEKIGVKSIKHKYGADPAAVIFDAVEHAKAKGIDFVLADTAGRAHTNANLMDQMKKIVRVNKPDIKILVIDSLTGNDALFQAKMYGEIGVDALIFTKVDVNEKGGAILSVTNELKKPILFLGLGQDYSHFEEFDAKKFVDNLVQ